MRYRVDTDPFHEKQPPLAFLDDLTAPVHRETPYGWNRRAPKADEVFLTSVKLVKSFPDPEGLLETAYEDFSLFLSLGLIKEGEGYPIITEQGETPCRESYRISVSEQECRITAADTEGIRRAVIFLEDEMRRRSGAFLPKGEIKRSPFVKTRISRCFFSPPSHAPNEIIVNELANDIDYYPEAYLNRLAHDGINGLWLGASFRDLLTSDIIPEYGQDGARRLKKLNAVIEKCRRYGIGIYLFSVEPASSYDNDAFEENHKDLHGARVHGKNHYFCPSTEGCMDYIKESVTRLFTAVPNLAGFIDITTGEAGSGCGSDSRLRCERCKEKFGSLAATLTATEAAIAKAVKEVKPEAEFISWTYSQRSWLPEEVKEACELRSTDVIHMQNFEDLGHPVQLGKKRLAMDYWLSYVGPGDVMENSLAINRRRGVRTYAKIQACSSHEISTVPYVPAPGILYDKYKYMYENGITGALQCWYFGNYPCMMNKAASELSFTPFFGDKKAFLTSLAGIYWGEDAEAAALAFEAFEEGYKNFPTSVSFEWYGPMQDSPAVPLRLKPVDLPMPGTWITYNPTGGDRIGEALLNGHTLDEARELVSRMCASWHKGHALISSLEDGGTNEKWEQKSCAAALDLIFESGKDILDFYALRRKLALAKGEDAKVFLSALRALVEKEIGISRALLPICERDGRIGYHSEAHGYKIFPERLLWRIGELEKLLSEEFSEVEARIEAGLHPLAFWFGEEEDATVYSLKKQPIEAAPLRSFVTDRGEEFPYTFLSASEDETGYWIRITVKNPGGDCVVIKPEFNLFMPTVPLELGGGLLHVRETLYYSVTKEKAEEEWRKFTCTYEKQDDETDLYTLRLDRETLGMRKGEPFRLALRRYGKLGGVLVPDDRVFTRLIQNTYSPDAYCFFVPEP